MAQNVPIKAIDKTLMIAQGLQEHECVGVTELANEVDLPRSTVFNHLKSLEEHEFVVNEEGSYRLGCRFLKLGAKARSYYDAHEAARQEINRLAKDTGDIAGLLIEEHGLGVFLHRAEGEQAVHIDSYIGQRIHLHSAALGKAILATLPRKRVIDIIDERGLPALTDNTITDRDELFRELDHIQEEGVAFDDQERLDGLRSVAVPITDDKDRILGSVSIAGPTSRVQDERFRETFPSKLRDVTNLIELDLTYS